MTLFLNRIGALTSKPYAFSARPWELKRYNTIDLFDSLGSNLIVDIRSSEIMRITPQVNDNLNEEWITDKARFSYDLLNKWRFNTPILKADSNFINITWKEALSILSKKFFCKRTLVNLKVGSILDLDNLFLLKKLIYKNRNVLHKSLIGYGHYAQNEKIYKASNILLYNINLRLINPILNLKLRRKSTKSINSFLFIGTTVNNTVYAKHLGLSFKLVNKLLKGKNHFSIKFIKNNFCLITKYSKITKNFSAFTKNVNYLSEYHVQNNLSVLNISTKKSAKAYKRKIDYFVGQFYERQSNNFTILQSSYISKNVLDKFDLVLPTLNWFEEEQKNFNCFLSPQVTTRMMRGPVNVKSNRELLTFLLDGQTANLLDLEVGFSGDKVLEFCNTKYKNTFSKIPKKPNAYRNYDYHLSSKLLVNSSNMANSSKEFFKGKNDFLIDIN